MTQFINDAQALSFLQQTHAHVESELYQVKYPEYNYAELMYVDTVLVSGRVLLRFTVRTLSVRLAGLAPSQPICLVLT